MTGLYVEEFVVIYAIQNQLTKTFTESNKMFFSKMTLNLQPLHINFAAKNEWSKRLVNSLFTLGLMIGISVYDITLSSTISNLGMTKTTFPHPVFHGDTIRIEMEMLSVRESKSKADRSIFKFLPPRL